MKTKKCSKCGNENPMENVYCAKCGAPFRNMVGKGSGATDQNQEGKEETGKKKVFIGITACGVLALLVLLFLPVYGAWSEWSLEIPDDVKDRKVETVQQYRSRGIELAEYDSKQEESADVEYVDQWEEWSEYGTWSDWQTESITASDACDVESELRYRSREVGVAERYSGWSEWSGWSATEASKSDTVDVESRDAYCYNVYRYECSSCGGGITNKMGLTMYSHAKKIHGNPADTFGEWLVQSDDAISASEALQSANYRYSSTTLIGINSELAVNTGSSPYVINSGGSEWYTNSAQPSKIEKQYRTRTRTLEKIETYSEWTDFTANVLTEDDDTQVESQMFYRSRTREVRTIYQYRIWGAWGAWQREAISQTTDIQVEEETLYRYADKCTLWEKLIG